MATLLTQPCYQKLTATASLGTSTYNLTPVDDHSGWGALVDNPNVLDIDLTLGNMVINLFSLSDIFVGGSMGLGFTISGTIVAAAGVVARTLVIRAFNSGGEVDTICGNATATIVGTVGVAFTLTPAGRNNWELRTCLTGAQP